MISGPKAFRYLFWPSLVFVIVFLYRMRFLTAPEIRSPLALLGSFACLISSFIFHGLAWRALLIRQGYPITLEQCVSASGLSVFTKYIPGKVFSVLGRAAYLRKRVSYSLAELSWISLTAQLVALWSGLTIGGLGILYLNISEWKWSIVGLWVVVSATVFTDLLRPLVLRVIGRVWKRVPDLPRVHIRTSVSALPWSFTGWVLTAAGFQLLCTALLPGRIPPAIGLTYPFAMSVGILAVFAPGGLAVTEGTLAGILMLSGIDPANAVTISVTSRLWFVAGESIIFLTGWLLDRKAVSRLPDNEPPVPPDQSPIQS